MKSVLMVAVMTLIGSFASAGILDAQQYNYEDGAGRTPAPCVDGTTKIFSENRANGLDGLVNVRRTCVNGTYFPKKAVTIRRCVEGTYSFVTEADANFDIYRHVTYVCRDGKHVPARN